MPEGHTTHRIARLHNEAFGGRPLTVSSPQGRFADGAARLDGRVLEAVEAHGKHLLYRWAGGDTLHVHLGLVGTFRTHGDDPPEPSPQTRLVLARPDPPAAAHLAGPMACELIDPAEEAALRDRLGPDPLGDPEAVDAFVARLATRRAPVGQVLLDQTVVAGIGNAFRAEALFVCGIDPQRPARALPRDEAAGLWGALCRMLAEGERTGRIHTVDGADDAGGPARYVYRREGEPCRRCGALVRGWPLGGRSVFACPRCQGPATAASADVGS